MGTCEAFVNALGREKISFPRLVIQGQTAYIESAFEFVSFFTLTTADSRSQISFLFFFLFTIAGTQVQQILKLGEPLTKYLLSLCCVCSITSFLCFKKLFHHAKISEHRFLFSNNFTVIVPGFVTVAMLNVDERHCSLHQRTGLPYLYSEKHDLPLLTSLLS